MTPGPKVGPFVLVRGSPVSPAAVPLYHPPMLAEGGRAPPPAAVLPLPAGEVLLDWITIRICFVLMMTPREDPDQDTSTRMTSGARSFRVRLHASEMQKTFAFNAKG